MKNRVYIMALLALALYFAWIGVIRVPSFDAVAQPQPSSAPRPTASPSGAPERLVLEPAPVSSAAPSCAAFVRRAAFQDAAEVRGPVWMLQISGRFERLTLEFAGGSVVRYQDDRASGLYAVSVPRDASGPWRVRLDDCSSVAVSDSKW